MKVKDFFKEGIPVIEMQNIKDDVFSTEFRRFISINLFDKLIRSKVKSEDIILSKTGSLGKIAIIPENFNKGIITSRLAKISLDKSKINLKYVYYFLIFFRKLGLWEKLGKGSTMKVLTIKKIANVNIPTPSLEEQSLIVEKIEQELTRLESAVNSLNNLKNKLKFTDKAY
jgi:type I restriction enzyme S subunit